MSVESIWAVFLVVASSIGLSIVANLITNYFFPDGGKKLMSKAMIVIGKSLIALTDILISFALVSSMLIWIIYPSMSNSIALGLMIAMLVTGNRYSEELKENRQKAEIARINEIIDTASKLSKTNAEEIARINEIIEATKKLSVSNTETLLELQKQKINGQELLNKGAEQLLKTAANIVNTMPF